MREKLKQNVELLKRKVNECFADFDKDDAKTIAKILVALLLLILLVWYFFSLSGADSGSDEVYLTDEEVKSVTMGSNSDDVNVMGERDVFDADKEDDDSKPADSGDEDKPPGTTVGAGGGYYPPPASGSKKMSGTSCSSGSECSSGYCVDGVCCNSGCNGICQRCDAYDGTAGVCHNVNNNHDPDNECAQTAWSCSGSCKRFRGDGYCTGSGVCDTNDDVENISSGYVCTGAGVKTAVSSESFCYLGEDCDDGDCTASKWYTSCDGLGSCRQSYDDTDSHKEMVYAGVGYTLSSSCSEVGLEACGYSEFNTCNVGKCQKARNVYRCDAFNDCTHVTWDYDLESCPVGTACSGGECTAANVCNDDYQYCSGYSGYYPGGTGDSYYCQGGCDGYGVCDYATHCDQHFKVVELKDYIDAVRTDSSPENHEGNWIVDVGDSPQLGQVEIGIKGDGYRIATFNVEFADADLDWGSLDAGGSEGKAFMHYPGGFSAIPGVVDSSYTLYIQKGIGEKVAICPGAESLSEVDGGCPGLFYADEHSPDVEVVTEDGIEYWKISGLTGTGAFSLVGVKDTCTRLQGGEESDHDIQFTTSYAIDSSGDTIVVDFIPGQSTTDGSQDFDFNGIDVGDIDLEDDGVDKTLCTGANPCSAGAGIWGVNISTGSNDTITFTAPTDAGATEIASGSIVHIKIGLNADDPSQGNTRVKNPTVPGSYEIHIRLDNGSDIDFGELEIPIVDDDTVNITGYIDTVLSFDIDTSETDEDCDASGGAIPCDSHGGASDDVGYVVDLGEMTLTTVTKSGDNVLHADGLAGNINYIWFDLESNADGGSVVTVVSLNERLEMDGSNYIPDVAGGSEQQITFADGLYGINHRVGLVNSTTAGTILVHDDCDCDSGDAYYCDVSDGGTPIEVFNSNGNPVDDGRVQWAVGAAPDVSDGTGTYTDQLTFIATATF